MLDLQSRPDSVIDAWTKFALRYPDRWARLRAVIEGPKGWQLESDVARLYVALYIEGGLTYGEIEQLQKGECP